MTKILTRKSLIGYLRMLRIEDWIRSTFWVPIFGAILAYGSLKSITLVGVIYFCATAYSFVVNNYFDVEIDRKHKGKIQSSTNPLAQGTVSEKGTLILLVVLLLLSLAPALAMNFIGFIFVLLSIIASTLYSVKHIRLKERNGLGIITSGVMFGLFPLLAGATLVGGNLSSPMILVGFLFMQLGSIGLIAHQVVDYEEDLGVTNTFVVKTGLKIGYISLVLLLITSILSFHVASKFFLIGWQLYYIILLGLILCFPVRYMKEIRSRINI